MLQNDRENYEKFFNAFGRQLKYGVVSDYGMHKEELQDLIMFYSSSEKKLVTLSEYVDRMKEDEKFIYFATGENGRCNRHTSADRAYPLKGLRNSLLHRGD